MKKFVLYAMTFLAPSFVLSALQGSLYFSPVALPVAWIICLTYYSFRKSLMFSLFMNIPMSLVVISFSILPIGRLLILINIISFFFYLTRERFHTSLWHIALASGSGLFFFLTMDWLLDGLWFQFSAPNLLSWFGMSLSTTIFAFPFIYILEKIDKKIEYERVDTLENLRI